MRRSCAVTTFSIVLFTIAGVLILGWEDNSQCNISTLVVAEYQMPEQWEKQWVILPPALPKEGSQQAYSVFFQKADKTASHTVYRYRNKWWAIFYRWFKRESFFSSSGWVWSDLRGAGSLPLHAEQVWIKCGMPLSQGLDERCTAVLRYGPYLSEFSASVGQDAMTMEDFQRIVLKIDGLFTVCRN